MVRFVGIQADNLLLERWSVVLYHGLSGIRAARFDSRTKMLIEEIPENHDTLAEWNLAVSYVTRHPAPSIQESKKINR